METLFQDLRYSFRLLLKRPGFTAVSILALALGIGANSAIFSVVSAVLLKPLPFAEPDRLVTVSSAEPKTGGGMSVAYPDFLDWRERNRTFEELAAVGSENFTLTGAAEAERLSGEWVSDNYFQALGVKAALGRTFLPEENRTPNTHPVVVVGEGLWRRRFGANPALIGSTVKLNDSLYTVVGIMPAAFTGFTGQAEVWVPMMMFETANPSLKPYHILDAHGTRWHQVIGRLKTGVTLAQAQTDLDAIAAQLAQAYPKTNADKGVQIVQMSQELIGNLKSSLLVLLGAVGFVLLIACANVANLSLARAISRSRELAIRAALGAPRRRLIRQLLTESIGLALLGGVLGLLLAAWGVDLLVAFLPVKLPSFVAIKIDPQVVGFTAFVSLTTGVLFGLVPALGASKLELNDALKERTKGAGSRSGGRVRSLLIVSEIALAFVLLIGAGLMLKSFQRKQMFDPGFKTDHLLTMRMSLPAQKYSEAEKKGLMQRVLERVEALPAVQAAGLTSHIYYGGGYLDNRVTAEGVDAATQSEGTRIYRQYVSPHYFAAMSIPMRAGRDFTLRDDEQAARVIVISQALAERYWPHESPVGKRIKFGRPTSNNPWFEIIGVVGEVKPRISLDEARALPQVYTPILQEPFGSSPGLVVRTKSDPASLTAALRQEINQLDSDIPLYQIATMEQLLAERRSDTRSISLLLSLFALLALALTAVGIYGVIAYSVTQRTQEIGIRLALGAQKSDVLKLVVGQGLLLAVIGVTLGLGLALGLTHFLTTLLFGVSATDPLTFVVIAVLLMLTALLACYLPARRATRVDPMVALRYE